MILDKVGEGGVELVIFVSCSEAAEGAAEAHYESAELPPCTGVNWLGRPVLDVMLGQCSDLLPVFRYKWGVYEGSIVGSHGCLIPVGEVEE